MGFRYRKSINLGGGFRINISKSGIGYSWGVKGARITKTATGKTRQTLSIPGTGISHVSESGSTSRASGKKNSVNNPPTIDAGTSTEIVNVGDFQPVEYADLLSNIKKVRMINLISTIMICTFLLAAVPVFIFTGIAGIVLKIFVHVKMGIPMEYEFDEESQQAYENLCSTWMSLNKNKKFWQIVSESSLNKKTSGGAGRGVKRIPAHAINKLPFYLKLNLRPFGLKLKGKKLFFLPDKLLILSGTKVGAINYVDLNMGLGTTRFVETDSVPKDAKVVDKTWLKVNKNGTPDKRYKGNRQVPVCEYGRVVIESGNSLYVEIQCSNSSTIDEMRQYVNKGLK